MSFEFKEHTHWNNNFKTTLKTNIHIMKSYDSHTLEISKEQNVFKTF